MSEPVFRQWVQEYTRDVYRYYQCNLRLSPELAEELTHKTFVAVWTSMSNFEERSSPKTWILSIARNIGKKAFRTQQRQQMSSEVRQTMKEETAGWSTLHYNPEDLLEEKQNRELLWDIIDSLSEKKREIFKLRYIQQFTIDELVELLGEPRETVRSRLRYARDEVKEKWFRKTKNSHR
ncbi:MAG: sigma-70 family RNA polymerase sigma factor [Deltaproteobacteria bacterium]|nr:MAG: sigma-70 family RNA polymerase sigma factor [Deltaproteobacteria bacterium]